MKTPRQFSIKDKVYTIDLENNLIVECKIKDICTDLEFQKKLDDKSISEYLGYDFKGGPKKSSAQYPKKIQDDMYLITYLINNEIKEKWVRKDLIVKDPKYFINDDN